MNGNSKTSYGYLTPALITSTLNGPLSTSTTSQIPVVNLCRRHLEALIAKTGTPMAMVMLTMEMEITTMGTAAMAKCMKVVTAMLMAEASSKKVVTEE